MGLCVSLMLEICGVMIFIAKKGGISLEVVHFLYFSKTVQTRLQYFLITLNQLGYLIAIVLLAGIREKMEYNDIPESFKGMPIVLLTSALMSIAFFGFSGLI